MFFLTDIDSRAAVKGSRDPLGLVPVWQRFGRKVVGNLTTATGSFRGFTTLLLGLHFADEVLQAGGHDESERVGLFLKVEQLCGYSRYCSTPETSESIRGITRVKRRVDSSGPILISAIPKHQILSDQKTYGLWGLYSVASRQTGLVEVHQNRLTPMGREIVERLYLPTLSALRGNRRGAAMLRFLEGDRPFEPKGRDRSLAKALAELHRTRVTKEEQSLYGDALVLGNAAGQDRTHGCQAEFWRLVESINKGNGVAWTDEFGFGELTETLKRARTRKKDRLVEMLERIQALEPLLVPAGSLFSFLLQRGGASAADVATEVKDAWGGGLRHLQVAAIGALRSLLAEALSQNGAERLHRLAEVLHAGDYAEAVRLLLDHNREVMQSRGGAAWVTVEGGRLNARLREETGQLFPREELAHGWRNTYFLNSLKGMGTQVYGKLL